jgi:hypothetical protein
MKSPVITLAVVTALSLRRVDKFSYLIVVQIDYSFIPSMADKRFTTSASTALSLPVAHQRQGCRREHGLAEAPPGHHCIRLFRREESAVRYKGEKHGTTLDGKRAR